MNVADEIQRLHQLHQSGALTDEEFALAKSTVLAGKSSGHPGAGSRCYKCGSIPNRACTLCGRFFCDQHGGERWAWTSSDGSKAGTRDNLGKRIICDDCTPSNTALRMSVVFAIVLCIVAGLLMAYAFKQTFLQGGW